MRFESVVYPAPLKVGQTPSACTDSIEFYPECPGEYRLQVAWRSPAGSHGVAICDFAVTDGQPVSLAPQRVSVNRRFDVWAPTGWDARHVQHYEPAALDAVAKTVQRGQVAYDVGANLGVYTMQLLEAVGPRGQVFSFELNPVCVSMLLATVRGAGATNCSIFPLALGDTDGTIASTVNVGSTALGITQSSGIFASKVGLRLGVTCVRLDTVMAEFALPRPDFVKIDVEGAEARVVAGMLSMLETHRPTLLIELHGIVPARETLALLEPLRYHVRDLEDGRSATTAEGFVAGMTDRPVQVLCVPL